MGDDRGGGAELQSRHYSCAYGIAKKPERQPTDGRNAVLRVARLLDKLRALVRPLLRRVLKR